MAELSTVGLAEEVPEIRHSHAMCPLALTATSVAGTFSCGSGQSRSRKRQRDRGHISRAKQGILQKPPALCQNFPLKFFPCLIRAVRVLHCCSPIFRAEALKVNGVMLGTRNTVSFCARRQSKNCYKTTPCLQRLVGLTQPIFCPNVKVFPPVTD